MTIYGTAPLDNENAMSTYSTSVSLIKDRILEWFDDVQDLDIAEPELMGYIVAVRGLAQAEPTVATIQLRVSEVEEWRDRYLNWFERHRGKVKVSRGVSKDEIARLARREFDAIIKALKKG